MVCSNLPSVTSMVFLGAFLTSSAKIFYMISGSIRVDDLYRTEGLALISGNVSF